MRIKQKKRNNLYVVSILNTHTRNTYYVLLFTLKHTNKMTTIVCAMNTMLHMTVWLASVCVCVWNFNFKEEEKMKTKNTVHRHSWLVPYRTHWSWSYTFRFLFEFHAKKIPYHLLTGSPMLSTVCHYNHKSKLKKKKLWTSRSTCILYLKNNEWMNNCIQKYDCSPRRMHLSSIA